VNPQGWGSSPEARQEPPSVDNHGWDAAPVRWDTGTAQPPAPPAWNPRAESPAAEVPVSRPPQPQGWDVEPQNRPRSPVATNWEPEPTQAPTAPAAEPTAPSNPWEAPLTPVPMDKPAADPYTSTDATDMFSADPRDVHGSAPRRSHTQLAPMIISLAAKGGVGKTSSATFLAQRAAEIGGLKVVLVDMNRGQGDIRKFLRLIGAPLPSVYEAALRGDPRMAIITPDRLTAARHVRLGKLGFALAMAPPETMLDTDQVNAGVYRDVIEEARTVADLVIVDTQIVEAVDTSELIDHVVIPALAKDAWALAISDVSMASVDNLKSRLTAFAEAGVPPDRVMFTVNRMSAGAVFNPEALADVFRHATTRVPLAHYVGAVAHDQAIADGMNVGAIEHNLPSIAPMLDTVLFRVTGLEVFDPARHDLRNKERKGLFSWLRARR